MKPREKASCRWHTLSTSLTWCRASRAQLSQPAVYKVQRMPQFFGTKDYEPVPRDLVTIGFVPEGMEVCSQVLWKSGTSKWKIYHRNLGFNDKISQCILSYLFNFSMQFRYQVTCWQAKRSPSTQGSPPTEDDVVKSEAWRLTRRCDKWT